MNKVDTLTTITSVLTKSYKAAQSILSELESEDTDQPNLNFRNILDNLETIESDSTDLK